MSDSYEYATKRNTTVISNHFAGNNNTQHTDHTVISRRSYRSETIRSDHVRSTPLSAQTTRIVSEEPYSYVSRRWYHTANYSWYLSTEFDSTWDLPVPADWGSHLDNLEARSLTVARQRLRQKDNMDLGVALAESRRTADMIGTRIGQMARGLINFRRMVASQPWSKRERLNQYAGAWLEGYYGWGSLANDAYSLYTRFNRNVDNSHYIKSSCVSKTEKSYPFSDRLGSKRTKTDMTGLVKVGYTAAIHTDFLREAGGWGVVNPGTIAWELMPWSFVIDWFIPVGNVIGSLTATAGLIFVDGYISTVSEQTDTTVSNYVTDEDDGYDGSRGQLVVHRKKFQRRPAADFEMPRLYVNENPFNTPRVLAALALATQAVTGRK